MVTVLWEASGLLVPPHFAHRKQDAAVWWNLRICTLGSFSYFGVFTNVAAEDI